jgi:hypothetical protein
MDTATPLSARMIDAEDVMVLLDEVPARPRDLLMLPDDTALTDLLPTVPTIVPADLLAPTLSTLESHWVRTCGNVRELCAAGEWELVGLPLAVSASLQAMLYRHVCPYAFGSRPTISCRPSFDFDTNGVLYWIGSRGGTRTWANPSASNLLSVAASGCAGVIHHSVGRESADVLICPSRSSSEVWWMLTLKHTFVWPTHYTLRQASNVSDTTVFRNCA